MVDVFLSSGSETIFLSVTPRELPVDTAAVMQTWSVLDVGEIPRPRGNEAARLSWECFLPGPARQFDAWVREWRHPFDIIAILGQWKANGNIVRVLATESQITGWDFYIERLRRVESGGHGDLTYQIDLVEARDIRVLTDAEEAEEAAAAAQAALVVTQAEPPRPATHLVTEEDAAFGDGWLGAIAKRHYGAWEEWATIYEANIDAIQAEVGPDSNIPAVGLELVLP